VEFSQPRWKNPARPKVNVNRDGKFRLYATDTVRVGCEPIIAWRFQLRLTLPAPSQKQLLEFIRVLTQRAT
jgi:hypothetical protein